MGVRITRGNDLAFKLGVYRDVAVDEAIYALNEGAFMVADVAKAQAPYRYGYLESAIEVTEESNDGFRYNRKVYFVEVNPKVLARRYGMVNGRVKRVGDYAWYMEKGSYDLGPGSLDKANATGADVGPGYMERALKQMKPVIMRKLVNAVRGSKWALTTGRRYFKKRPKRVKKR